MDADILLRDAREEDCFFICDIFNEVIASGNAIYRETPFLLSEIQKWFEAKRLKKLPVIVVEANGKILGFGATEFFRTQECCETTTELAVHVRRRFRGQGLGTKIINEIIQKSRARGTHSLVACIDSDNKGSLKLHDRLGFCTVGHMKEVARKNNQWLDLIIMEKKISTE